MEPRNNEGRRYFSVHQCWTCRIEWEATVELTIHTSNLSGENSRYCPRCGKRSNFASEVRAEGAQTKGTTNHDA